MMYDVFICHASEDKEGFVRSPVVQLQGQHVAVWYDDCSLQLGDSIRARLMWASRTLGSESSC
jgi:hypothetical protein